ncbi:MAG: EamA family transporter [Chthonomonas sp.]|nr:EamA family transporter [Chthonomonas sp.]
MKDFHVWALLSALFAGITAVLAKKGVEDVPPNLAVAVRVVVVLAFAAGIAVATKQTKISAIDSRAWTFLVLSGIATGLSWLCYFRALSTGPVAAVAPIDKLSFVVAMVLGFVILQERFTWQLGAGAALIVAGVLVTLSG